MQSFQRKTMFYAWSLRHYPCLRWKPPVLFVVYCVGYAAHVLKYTKATCRLVYNKNHLLHYRLNSRAVLA